MPASGRKPPRPDRPFPANCSQYTSGAARPRAGSDPHAAPRLHHILPIVGEVAGIVPLQQLALRRAR
jgi:hypothetical protein